MVLDDFPSAINGEWVAPVMERQQLRRRHGPIQEEEVDGLLGTSMYFVYFSGVSEQLVWSIEQMPFHTEKGQPFLNGMNIAIRLQLGEVKFTHKFFAQETKELLTS